ncbi:tetratricopeptide repeat protein [Umezawaea endophytica]|uniref:Tetratricopeptide repeat protein n=1 Tax=Umezawaea endophytica TaxID=1654476 RepID=A0A9X3ACQ7_9PSEU|nr:tetratricopeptide repeat protein [Umezawaea endophytica]MCS7475322.1 tetratricopeptide repeat protein [Umezawaea endophytica]
MPTPRDPDDAFAVLPDPGQADSLDDVVERLRSLKVWAGDPSYETIKDRVNGAWTAAGRPAGDLVGKTTVVDCFRLGRRRLNTNLVLAVVSALHPDQGYVAQWRQALRVVGGETRAAAQVRVQDGLPEDLSGFTGRAAELDALAEALTRGGRDGDPVVVSAIEGMAGVGKTRLAIHAAHLLARREPFDHVLFVNLRGFHPDPGQPPADPAAVLDGFLRLLGVPGHEIPHGLTERAAVYRDRLGGTRTLVLLDNAADEDQVRPLLPDSPGCPTLVTSRRHLTDLKPATHLAVDVFTPAEALRFLDNAAPGVPVGPSPTAADRIAARCGHLPLALSLVAGHIRATPDWTLTDHADRLDERHRDRRLEGGVELALDLSYRRLPAQRRRLLRLVALHPGQDFDAHAAAALVGTDLRTARTDLDHLCDENLLQATAGRHTFHDLVRAYAAVRAGDEDRPTERRAALTRLFDHYLAGAAAAMDVLYPAEAHHRPRIPAPTTPLPTTSDPDAARDWLDTERPILVAVAAHTANHGWPEHTTRLSATLFRYFTGGHFADAVAIHGHARIAAELTGDSTAQAAALTNLGVAHMQMGRHGSAAECFAAALPLFRRNDDRVGEARAVHNLGIVEHRLGRYAPAGTHYERALELCRLTGDRTGEAGAHNGLGMVEFRLGRLTSSADHHERALALVREAGDRLGEANTLMNLGDVEVALDRLESAADHLGQTLALYRAMGDRDGEAWTSDSLGVLELRRGRPDLATDHHERALVIHRETGERDGEANALNGLGEAAQAAGRAADALAHHTAALAITTATGAGDERARAHTGLGNAHRELGDVTPAREEYGRALALYTELGMPEADVIRSRLTALDGER